MRISHFLLCRCYFSHEKSKKKKTFTKLTVKPFKSLQVFTVTLLFQNNCFFLNKTKKGAYKHVASLLSVLFEEFHITISQKNRSRRVHALFRSFADPFQQARAQHSETEQVQTLQQVYLARALHERTLDLRSQFEFALATQANTLLVVQQQSRGCDN